ncbi:MAG TPA: MarR family winged helix-turn-helix transcriptional regulator [Hyphomicrobiales bacterium]|nr:MarR family winged helix-turn-helix transcriptional regulator [Hyphomicrobiales bacterium]
MPVTLRASQALTLLHEFALAQVQDGEPDLSARQIAVLLTVYLEAPPHTVRGLAAKLGVGKPVITRALDTMGRIGLLARRRDDRDRRNVIVDRTDAGVRYVERLAALIAATVEELTP